MAAMPFFLLFSSAISFSFPFSHVLEERKNPKGERKRGETPVGKFENSVRKKKRRLKRMISAGLLAGFSSGFAAYAAPPVHAETKTTMDTPDTADITNILADYSFKKTDIKGYFRNGGFIYARPYESSDIIASVMKKMPIHITGIGTREFWEAEFQGKRCYVKASDVVTDISIIDESDAQAAEVTEKNETSKENYAKKQEEIRRKKEEARKKAEEEKKKKEKKKKAKEKAEKKKAKAAKSVRRAEKILASQETKTKAERTQTVSAAYANATTNTAKIWIYLTEHGFTDIQAAGIMGNIQCESDFNPRATDGGHGLFQWLGGRRANLYSFASDPWDIDDQLAFMIHELNTSESTAYQKLKAAKTPEEAAYMFDVYYERSAGISRAKRMACAAAWYKKYGSSNNVSSGLTADETAELNAALKSQTQKTVSTATAAKGTSSKKSNTSSEAKPKPKPKPKNDDAETASESKTPSKTKSKPKSNTKSKTSNKSSSKAESAKTESDSASSAGSSASAEAATGTAASTETAETAAPAPAADPAPTASTETAAAA